MKAIPPAPRPATPARQRVLIVDDHPFLLQGLSASLEREPGLTVAAAVASAAEALAEIARAVPDLIVADLNLPDKHGLELIKELAVSHPALPVVVLSMHEEAMYAERCLRAGARGYVMKSAGADQLIAAVRAVLAGEIFVSPPTAARILRAFSGGQENETPLRRLSDREFEVFQALGRGLSTQQIAGELAVGTKTIETHRLNIKSKLGLETAAELIAFAARWSAATE